ncbi:MAG TPA: hypothetical protein V6D23_15920, partial [Candidatus Obscuribacterales bacterium]
MVGINPSFTPGLNPFQTAAPPKERPQPKTAPPALPPKVKEVDLLQELTKDTFVRSSPAVKKASSEFDSLIAQDTSSLLAPTTVSRLRDSSSGALQALAPLDQPKSLPDA